MIVVRFVIPRTPGRGDPGTTTVCAVLFCSLSKSLGPLGCPKAAASPAHHDDADDQALVP
jgi:hypothetical protein